MQADVNQTSRDRIVVVGRSQSGKTVYIVRLYHQLWNMLNERFYIKALSGSNHKWLMERHDEMLRGNWPKSTSGQMHIDCELEYKGNSKLLTMLDFSGETFSKAFVTGESIGEPVEVLKEHVDRAKGVIILIDPINVSSSQNSTLPIDDTYGMTRLVDRIRTWPNGKYVPIAIVFTKSDVRGEMIREFGGAENFANLRIPQLVNSANAAGKYVDLVRVFECTAVHMQRGMPDLSAPPQNVIEPVEWILETIEAQLSKSVLGHQKGEEYDLNTFTLLQVQANIKRSGSKSSCVGASKILSALPTEAQDDVRNKSVMLEIQKTIRDYNENAEWRRAKSWTWVVVAVLSIIVFFAVTWSQGFALMIKSTVAQQDSDALKADEEKVKQAEKQEGISKREEEEAKVKLGDAEKKIAFARKSFEIANIAEKQFVENKEFSDAQNGELTKLEKQITNDEEAVKNAQSDVDRVSKSTVDKESKLRQSENSHKSFAKEKEDLVAVIAGLPDRRKSEEQKQKNEADAKIKVLHEEKTDCDSKVKKLEEEIKEKNKEYEDCKKEGDIKYNKKEELRKLKVQLDLANQDVKNAENKIEKRKDEEQKEGQNLHESFEIEVKANDSKLKELDQKQEKALGDVEGAKKEYEESKLKLHEANKKLEESESNRKTTHDAKSKMQSNFGIAKHNEEQKRKKEIDDRREEANQMLNGAMADLDRDQAQLDTRVKDHQAEQANLETCREDRNMAKITSETAAANLTSSWENFWIAVKQGAMYGIGAFILFGSLMVALSWIEYWVIRVRRKKAIVLAVDSLLNQVT